jgi:hypothetical protein
MSANEIPSKEQLEALEIWQRIRLTRILFYVVIVAFIAILIALIVAMFLPWVPPNLQILLGAIELILAGTFYPIVRHLYPNRDPQPPATH